MAHHAFFAAGDREEGITAALTFAESELGMSLTGSPDILIERYGLFRVEDARRIAAKADLMPLKGDQKLLIIAASRIFHEAQNAMLKLFEEPPKGTTLVLVVPSEGDLIYTLRSRLMPLPGGGEEEVSKEAEEYIAGTASAREKLVEKILDDAKSDSDEDKQEARASALRLAEGLARAGYAAWRKESGPDSRDALHSFLTDLDRLIPILHDRSAPLKPILEHIVIITPKKLG